jgi:hypothetical protein
VPAGKLEAMNSNTSTAKKERKKEKIQVHLMFA